jgi:ankyrin repeat protein
MQIMCLTPFQEQMNLIEQSIWDLQSYAANGDVEMIRLFEQRKINLDMPGMNGYTALHVAARWGHPKAVKLLLDRGADTNAPVDGEAFIKCVQSWLDKPYSRSNSAWGTLLRVFGRAGCSDARTVLDGLTALHIAAGWGHESVVLLLLDKGADINAKTSGNLTALHLAVGYGKENVALILLNKGANVQEKTTANIAIFILAQNLGSIEPTKIVRAQLDELEKYSGIERTSLDFAVASGNMAFMKHLLRHGAEGSIWGLYTAVILGHKDIVRLLLDCGVAATGRTDEGMTILHHVASRGDIEMAWWLLEKGADPEAKNDQGITPAQLAVFNGHTSVANLFHRYQR